MSSIAPPKPPRCYNIVSLRTASKPPEQKYKNRKSGFTIELDETLFTRSATENSSNENNCEIKVNYRLIRGCSRLMYACQQGLMDTVVRELRAKPERVRQRDSSNKSVLHYCSGQNNIVAAASVTVAAPDLLESADEDGFTPLHLAVIQGNLAMVNLLLANKADVNAVDNEGHSVVHWATVCGEVEALRSILQAGANIKTPDINGGSPLHYAAQMCGANYDNKLGQATSSKLALEILDILLSHPQSSVDITDRDGRKPLLWAASAGSAKAVLALVKAGSRVESADKDGLTALHCAASRGHTECIDTLISLCGASTDLIDSNGCTALHYAVTLGHADATSRLLDLDADPNRQDRKGRTPAHCGCAKGQLETVKLLKEWGANLWLRNAKGDLPLHEAASSGRRELVEWLLTQKPKQVNTTSNDGKSLLHIAASNDYTDICQLLIDYGADVNSILRTSKGVAITPLDCALQKGYRSTAKFLQSNGGLPASKLQLSARRPNAFTDRDLVKPLKYTEREAIQTPKGTKKCVKKSKRYDSDSSDTCSCNEHTYRKEHTYTHTCRHHRKRFRRRTSSCGEAKSICREDSCSDICRSKSNIEIRRRQSRDRLHTSDSEDSCENCCYHKKKLKFKRKERTSRKTNEIQDIPKNEYISNKKNSVVIDNTQIVNDTKLINNDEKSLKRPSSETKGHGQSEFNIPDNVKSTIDTNSLPVVIPQSISLTDDDIENSNGKHVVVTKADIHAAAEIHNLSPDGLPVENTGESNVLMLEDQKMLSDGTIATISEDINEVLEAGTAIDNIDAKEDDVIREHSVKDVDDNSSRIHNDGLHKEETGNLEKIEGETLVDNQHSNLSNLEQASAENTNVSALEQKSIPETQILAEIEEEPLQRDKEQKPDANDTVISFESDVLRKDDTPAEKSIVNDDNDYLEKDTRSQNLGIGIDSMAVSSAQHVKTTEAEDCAQLPSSTELAISTEKEQSIGPQLTKQTSSSQVIPEEISQQSREEESRRSFTLLPDSPDNLETQSRKSSFHVLKSDESVDIDEAIQRMQTSDTFQVVTDAKASSDLNPEFISDVEAADYEENAISSTSKMFPSHSANVVHNDYAVNGRKRRLKRRIKSGGARGRNHGKSKAIQLTQQHLINKDHDSGFEPSPRAIKTKIPTPRSTFNAYVPRKAIYATLDGRLCSGRLENRKPGDKGACDMSAVTRSIQRNVRRYYMERKIFQHLLELKNLQIRSNKLNEAVLVKRAVDDYHKSCIALGGETGTTLRRYPYSEYTFKNFELFLYETLKSLQRPGTFNFQNINDVYEEAERRLSPDYNAYEKALQCTTKTHRCLHATHAYTGIPCAAYIPMMNHHTIPKFGFGSYKKTGAGSFYLPKILSSHQSCGSRVSLELSHGKNKQLISLPSEKLDSNKRYYVTFTVKEPGGKQQLHNQQQQHPLAQPTAYEDNDVASEKNYDEKKLETG